MQSKRVSSLASRSSSPRKEGDYAFDTERWQHGKSDRAATVRVNADRKVVETAEELIALFKREFSEQWQNAFVGAVSIEMRSGTA